MTPDQVLEQALIDQARTDPVTFNDYVLRDERDGSPTLSAPMHEEWHKLIDRHPRLVLVASIESGKSFALSVGRVLYELGRNPDLRVVVASNTAGQASKLVRAVGQYIETSDELHRVFPKLRPDASGPWTSTALTVQRSGPARDPSVQAVGLHGNVLGSRVDLLIADDVCDYENTRTEPARDDLDRWVRSTLLGRLTADSRAWILGNTWHRDDLYQRLERSGWSTFRFPVLDEQGRPRWPERWPLSRVASVRRDLGPREAARQLDCVPPDDADPVIEPDLIARMLQLGENATTEHLASAADPGGLVVLGCDVAYSEKRTADESALVLTRGAPQGRREVTQVTAGRWGFDELVQRIVTQCQLQRAIAAIESNAGGEFVAQAVERSVPVVRCHTSVASRRMRVEMFISEAASSRWSFRQPGYLPDEMRKLAQELLSFSFEEHTGDRAAAFFVAVEALRQRENRPKAGWRHLNLHALKGQ